MRAALQWPGRLQQRAHVCVRLRGQDQALLGRSAVGESIRINGVIFTVVGTASPKMQETNDDINRTIYVPFNTMSDLKDTTYLDGVWIGYHGDYQKIEKTIRETLAAAHHFRTTDHDAARPSPCARSSTSSRFCPSRFRLCSPCSAHSRWASQASAS